jgi:hypothetical protein
LKRKVIKLIEFHDLNHEFDILDCKDQIDQIWCYVIVFFFLNAILYFFFKHLVYFELVFKIYFILVSIKLISFDLFFIGFFINLIFFKCKPYYYLSNNFPSLMMLLENKFKQSLYFFLCFKRKTV